MRPPGDADLIARARQRDKSAFEDLLRPVIAPAARLAYGMLQDRSAAEDVVQEAALKAWRRLDNIRPGSDFRPWFLGIVANQARSTRRALWWSVLRLDHTTAKVASEEATVRGADLRRALLRVPLEQRAAILLHFYLDLPLDEVAIALGISVPGVKSRINRGLKRMRPGLQSYEAVL
jgi:RNA polymerase sigma-70 factor (ECF subfamily)